MVTRNIQEVKDLISSKFDKGIKVILIDDWTSVGKLTIEDFLV